MLVKDEADVIDYVVRYLVGQVDHVIVCDNASTDGTFAKLLALRDELGVEVVGDADPAYYQARKTSELAEYARSLGHKWVVPCDADEVWYATDGRTLREFLGGLAPDVAYVQANLYNHLPSAIDAPATCAGCLGSGEVAVLPGDVPDPSGVQPPCVACGGLVQPNPFLRIGWRQREHGKLPKVAARLRLGLEIRQGNHSAWAPGSGLAVGGLVVRHFSWRTPEQYVRKIANGYRAYAETDLPEDVGGHWRMFGPPDEPSFDERVRAHFEQWFFVRDPYADASLIYDPAPYSVPA